MAVRKPYQSDGTSMELNMTPMIDVIFQLMIFFMCSIHFKSLEGKLYSYLPKNKGGGDGGGHVIPDVRIKLMYSETAPLMTRIYVGDNVISDWDSLYKHIQNLVPTLITPDGLEIIPVKIDADDKVPTQAVINALNICKKAGVPKTEFAAKTPPKRSVK